MPAQISTKNAQRIQTTDSFFSRLSKIFEEMRVVITALKKLLHDLKKLLHDLKDVTIEAAVVIFLIMKIIEYLYGLPHH